MIRDSELILNPDGSIYHLCLLPEDLADIVITVGDPDRVEKVSRHFDRLELINTMALVSSWRTEGFPVKNDFTVKELKIH